jgi:hypothetical protein
MRLSRAKLRQQRVISCSPNLAMGRSHTKRRIYRMPVPRAIRGVIVLTVWLFGETLKVPALHGCVALMAQADQTPRV